MSFSANQWILDLSGPGWALSGWTPNLWQLKLGRESNTASEAEIPEIPACVPSSVQETLRNAKLLPDWNVALQSRQCEWVENRQWIYRREFCLPADGSTYDLVCEALDYSGWVLVDGDPVGTFRGSARRHIYPMPGKIADGRKHNLCVVFDLPPRWLGQFGDTRELTVGKARFNYTWDWMARLVQTGIPGKITLQRQDLAHLRVVSCDTTANSLLFRAEIFGGGSLPESLTIQLRDGATTVREEQCPRESLAAGIAWEIPDAKKWHLNGHGTPYLYTLEVHAEDKLCWSSKIGFRTIRRLPCEGAPEGAEPWLFEVNGETVFIQGINWTAPLPNYADVPEEKYRRLIADYRAMHVNLLRVWGGAVRERDLLYELCDEAGIMIWQEFPVCSSGIVNLPPRDPETIAQMRQIAGEYLEALMPHPSLALWCGGNELFHNGGAGRPCRVEEEPLLQMFSELVNRHDFRRGFVPTSASGPTEYCEEENYGRALHHDVHGPWKPDALPLDGQWREYWAKDDALFRSEFGAPGAMNADLIRKYAGGAPILPISAENPIWRNPLSWWLEIDAFREEKGRISATLEEYVNWSQSRQAEALEIAAGSAKNRFPRCGGVIVWMGHDAYPCFTNTSLIDFEGNWKPAAYAIQMVYARKTKEKKDEEK
ncbi:MAG: hypothetical protein PHS41_06585 [Victivallaceae bacterium]|nr:hypothetical protein [Victivallaceae bacterium]